MRLILEDNSINLLCSPEDVARFQEDSEVEQSVVFGDSFGDKFIFSLRNSHSYEELNVTLIANELKVFVPKPLAHEWCHTDRLGFGETIYIGEGRKLDLWVEKYFPTEPGEVEPEEIPTKS